jgi:hypothetical protein
MRFSTDTEHQAVALNTRQLRLFIDRPLDSKKVVDWPLYTEIAPIYYRPIRKWHIQEM